LLQTGEQAVDFIAQNLTIGCVDARRDAHNNVS
jgi:hypothetical protein